MLNTIQSLLNSVSQINTQYEKVAKVTGENFNVFRILKLEAREVKTHSAFLAELLNPNGSHGYGNVFLELFVRQQKAKQQSGPKENKDEFIKRLEKFNTERAEVFIEHYLGNVKDDNSEGGRIDILIKSDNLPVIIENKINALDGICQLIRYHNHHTGAAIFYLTLDGRPPSKDSICHNGKALIDGNEFVCISYKHDILDWLEACREKSVTYTLVRETLTQYINLIKYLTHQTMNEEMEKEIVDKIATESNSIKAAELIAQAWDVIKMKIIENVVSEIKERLGKEGYTIEYPDNIGLNHSSISICPQLEWNHHAISVYFEPQFCLSIGIFSKGGFDDSRAQNDIKDIFQDAPFGRVHKLGSDWTWLSDFDQWNNCDWGYKKVNGAVEIIEAVKKIVSRTEHLEL